jgi:hypothetical protein
MRECPPPPARGRGDKRAGEPEEEGAAARVRVREKGHRSGSDRPGLNVVGGFSP